jgi:hypothetical protein
VDGIYPEAVSLEKPIDPTSGVADQTFEDEDDDEYEDVRVPMNKG